MKKLKSHLLLYIALFLIFILINIYFTFTYRATKQFAYKVGDIAKKDILVLKDVEYIDEAETEVRRKVFLANIPPVYLLYEDKFTEEWIEYEKVFNQLLVLRDDIQAQQRLIQSFTNSEKLSAQIINIYSAYAGNEQKIDMLKNILYALYAKGITLQKTTELPASELGSITVHWYRKNEIIQKTLLLSDLVTSSNIDKEIQKTTKLLYTSINQSDLDFFSSIISLRIKQNIYYDPVSSEEDKKLALLTFKPVKNIVKRGKVIVRYGEEIRPEDITIIKMLNAVGNNVNIKKLLMNVLFILLIGGILYFYLLKEPLHSLNTKHYLIYYFSLLFFVFIFFLIYKSYAISIYPQYLFIPVILLFFLIDFAYKITEQYIIYFSIIMIDFILLDYNILFLLYSTIIFMALRFSYKEFLNIRKNILIQSGVGLVINIISFLVFSLGFSDINYTFVAALRLSFLNTFGSMILFFGLVPFIENVFNFPTTYKLIEISDLNNKWFTELLLKAPGTYHHSIIVAALCEHAALACGANPYIAKAGGLYHDIGKMRHSQYFIENQNGYNPTIDILNPSMAVSIIKNHVKLGIGEGKKLRLPEEVISIIEEHHGTTTITYFYQKALENDEGILKEDFSYSYPKPSSKEAVIVMIADSVEAISRTLSTFNYNQVKKIVSELINSRFVHGQFDEAPITLKDLKQIEEAMIKHLSVMIHQRIQYPENETIRELEKKNKRVQ